MTTQEFKITYNKKNSLFSVSLLSIDDNDSTTKIIGHNIVFKPTFSFNSQILSTIPSNEINQMLENMMESIVKKFDHKFLIPVKSPKIEISDTEIAEYEEPQKIEIAAPNFFASIPTSDILLLPSETAQENDILASLEALLLDILQAEYPNLLKFLKTIHLEIEFQGGIKWERISYNQTSSN